MCMTLGSKYFPNLIRATLLKSFFFCEIIALHVNSKFLDLKKKLSPSCFLLEKPDSLHDIQVFVIHQKIFNLLMKK